MKLVSADPNFGDDGFEKAVQVDKIDVENIQKVQAIIDFAYKEGKGQPIIDEGAGKLILVQLGKDGDQYTFPMGTVQELKDSLEDLLD